GAVAAAVEGGEELAEGGRISGHRGTRPFSRGRGGGAGVDTLAGISAGRGQRATSGACGAWASPSLRGLEHASGEGRRARVSPRAQRKARKHGQERGTERTLSRR